jgi:hypothetical protein
VSGADEVPSHDAGIPLQQASMAWVEGAETAPAFDPCGVEAARTEKTAALAGPGMRGFVVAMAKNWTFVSAFAACGRSEPLMIRCALAVGAKCSFRAQHTLTRERGRVCVCVCVRVCVCACVCVHARA